MMRVISGRAKGRKLKKVPGDTTRPIMDRVKENLFNILGGWVVETRWLDLFAGTGQVGIEALSRGASSVVFVDMVRPAIRTVQANLKHTQLTEGAEVVQANAFDYLRRGGGLFDVIYVAPPQYKGIWIEIMRVLDERPSAHLTSDGIIIVQIDPKEYEELELTNLTLYQSRRYGNTQLCFYELSETDA
ncbi:MAG: 16S rRNA (guanine(966)-N(2))-methyltransferase RsmD [Chloroflexi bacterium]|nr:16S rRNA (guanine(966)-N(2))-methyltransferase RsmD [Chloroflexota bacterium]